MIEHIKKYLVIGTEDCVSNYRRATVMHMISPFWGSQVAWKSQVSFGFQTAVGVGVPVYEYDAILVDREEFAASSLLLL